MPFILAEYIRGLPDYMEASQKNNIRSKSRQTNVIHVQDSPLYSMLKELDVQYVEYFSLDAEGAELEVLYTMRLDLVTIDEFGIEYVVNNVNCSTKERLESVKNYWVRSNGYSIVRVGFR